MGGTALPYDARMNGIYLGALVTIVWHCCGPVLTEMLCHRDWSRSFVLLGFGAVMALDGFNSLLADLQLWHPYETTNWMRLVTGMAAGITLGVALVFLMGTTLWRRPVMDRQTLQDWRVLVPITAVLAGFVALVVSGVGWLYLPMVFLLIGATILVLACLGLVLITILMRRDYTFDSFAGLGIN